MNDYNIVFDLGNLNIGNVHFTRRVGFKTRGVMDSSMAEINYR